MALRRADLIRVARMLRPGDVIEVPMLASHRGARRRDVTV
jgi:hypothetical protein